MANFVVTNSLYPDNPKIFTVSIERIVKPYGEPNTKFERKGSDDIFWEVHVAVADAIDINGNKIKSVWKDISYEQTDTVNSFIIDAVNTICAQIDWTQSGVYSEQEDKYPPFVTETSPENGATDVSIHQRVVVTLEDKLPAVGIDVDTIKLYVDDIEVVPTKITGHPFRYDIYYKVPVVYDEIED